MTSDSMGVSTLIAGMFLTGCANSLLCVAISAISAI